MNITPYLKTFLNREDVKDLLNNNEFTKLYEACAYSDRTYLTVILKEAGVNPLPYLKYIPENFITNNPDIESIKIPAQCDYIGEEAFGMCSNLTKLLFEVNSKLNTIERSAFYETHIKFIDLPYSLEFIGEFAFSYCDLSAFNIVTSKPLIIGSNAFSNNNNLTKVHFPHLKVLSVNVLKNCPVESIIFEDSESQVWEAVEAFGLNIQLLENQTFEEFLIEYLGLKTNPVISFRG